LIFFNSNKFHYFLTFNYFINSIKPIIAGLSKVGGIEGSNPLGKYQKGDQDKIYPPPFGKNSMGDQVKIKVLKIFI
jgi:hypothetical protein